MISRHQELVCATRLCQNLIVAVTLSLMLAGACVFGLGLGIRHGVLVAPTLNLRHHLIRVTAYRTHYPECPPYTQCPPQSVAPPEEYYVVWLVHEGDGRPAVWTNWHTAARRAVTALSWFETTRPRGAVLL
jgi:hypothetical protein